MWTCVWACVDSDLDIPAMKLFPHFIPDSPNDCGLDELSRADLSWARCVLRVSAFLSLSRQDLPYRSWVWCPYCQSWTITLIYIWQRKKINPERQRSFCSFDERPGKPSSIDLIDLTLTLTKSFHPSCCPVQKWYTSCYNNISVYKRADFRALWENSANRG